MAPAKNLPRLLAPAAEFTTARACLDSGADTLYGGVKGWSLRPTHFELSEDELHRIIELAHSRKRSFHLVMNCFYRGSELAAARDRIARFLKWGIDACIVSDLGLARRLKIDFPDLPIHLSVQNAPSNHLDLEFYRDLGINGVVLPRNYPDLEPEVIRKLAGVGVELAVFLIGDDSAFYDGRCLFSSYFHQREVADSTGREAARLGSANRSGFCYLQCKREGIRVDRQAPANRGGDGLGARKPWLLRGDLALYRRITELIESGITTFKIQGREFPPGLVGRMVKEVRSIIDHHQDPDRVEIACRRLDRLVAAKGAIAANHLWLLARSRSPFWKGIRPWVEGPWDAWTTFRARRS